MPLAVYDETNVEDVIRFARGGYGELINQVTIVYRDVVTNKDTPITVQNLAAIQSQGFIIPVSLDRPGYSNQAIASRAAMRELRARSIPLATGELRCFRDMWRTLPGEQFILSWPKRKIASVVMRVTQIDMGTIESNVITVSFMEDVFSLPTSSYAVEQPWTFPSFFFDPAPATIWDLYEVPYWMLWAGLDTTRLTQVGTGGYVSAVVLQPNYAQDSFSLHSRVGVEALDVNYIGSPFQQGASLLADITPSDTTISIQGSDILANTPVGTIGMIGSGATAEWVRFMAGGDYAATVVVRRGMFDTVPRAHPAGTRLWKVHYIEAIPTVKYATGDDVDGAIVTKADTGEISTTIAYDVLKSIILNSRAIRPYAPGKFKINNDFYPASVDASPFDVTWAHRDRLTFPAVTQTNNDVGPEAGTTYSVYVYDDDTNTLLSSYSGIVGTLQSVAASYTCNMRVEVESVRDGYTSWQRQSATFVFSPLSTLDESGDYFVVEDGGTYIDMES